MQFTAHRSEIKRLTFSLHSPIAPFSVAVGAKGVISNPIRAHNCCEVTENLVRALVSLEALISNTRADSVTKAGFRN